MKYILVNKADQKVVQIADKEFPVCDKLEWLEWSGSTQNLAYSTGTGLYNKTVTVDIQSIYEGKLQELSRFRDQELEKGVVFNGITIATDNLSQQRIIGASITAKEDPNYEVNWKAVNGWVTLTAPMIIAMSQVVRQHVQTCFDKAMACNVELDDLLGASDVSGLQEYNIEESW